jgi:hypothetical protein
MAGHPYILTEISLPPTSRAGPTRRSTPPYARAHSSECRCPGMEQAVEAQEDRTEASDPREGKGV